MRDDTSLSVALPMPHADPAIARADHSGPVVRPLTADALTALSRRKAAWVKSLGELPDSAFPAAKAEDDSRRYAAYARVRATCLQVQAETLACETAGARLAAAMGAAKAAANLAMLILSGEGPAVPETMAGHPWVAAAQRIVAAERVAALDPDAAIAITAAKARLCGALRSAREAAGAALAEHERRQARDGFQRNAALAGVMKRAAPAMAFELGRAAGAERVPEDTLGEDTLEREA